MKKALILYATREGQTEKIADAIKGHLQEAGLNVTMLNAKDKDAVKKLDLADFNMLVFGASVHARKIEKEMALFINRHAQAISNKPTSFFLVLLSIATSNAALRSKSIEDARSCLNKQLHTPLDEIEMIAGALLYTKYSFFVRWMMRQIVKKAGGDTDTRKDYEYTDWEQVKKYAQRLAGRLVL